MKNMKKILVLACCAVLLVCISVGATFAYLTSTKTVTNTFTSGSVDITLDETDVDKYGVLDGQTRVTANDYTLLPGHEYTKDPTIHIEMGSEECYLFVKIDDQIAAIQDTKTVAEQMAEIGWKLVTGETNIYWYKDSVDAREAAKDVKVFNTFKIKGDADVAEYNGKKIIVQAYAIQKDTFANAEAAWTAAPLEAWETGFATVAP